MTPGPMKTEETLTTLWTAVAQAHFLNRLTIYEALAALEKRSTLLQCLFKQNDTWIEPQTETASYIMDHFHTLLQAEMRWLERTLASLQTSYDTKNGLQGCIVDHVCHQ